MPPGIGRGVLKIEDQSSVVVILNASVEGRQLDLLRRVGFQQNRLRRKIVLRKQRTEFGIADVTAKRCGGVAVSTLSDVLGAKLVVIGEGAGTTDCEEIAGRPGVGGHPEAVEGAHTVIRSVSRIIVASYSISTGPLSSGGTKPSRRPARPM